MSALLPVVREWANRIQVEDELRYGPGVLLTPSRKPVVLACTRALMVGFRVEQGDIGGLPEVNAGAPVADLGTIRDVVYHRPEVLREVPAAEFVEFLGEPRWLTEDDEAWEDEGAGFPFIRRGWVFDAPVNLRWLACTLSLLPKPEAYRLATRPLVGAEANEGQCLSVYGEGWFVFLCGHATHSVAGRDVWNEAPRWVTTVADLAEVAS